MNLKKAELLSLESALNQYAIVAKTDISGIITHVNDRLCEISGYQPQELIGRNHRILNSGHHPKSFFENMWKTISAGKIWRDQVKNRAKDGTHYWVDTIISPVIEDGVVKQYIAFRFDITRDKKQQQISLAMADIRLQFAELSKDRGELFDFLTKKIILLTECESAHLGEDLASFEPELMKSISESPGPKFVHSEGKPSLVFPFYSMDALVSLFFIQNSNIHFTDEILKDFIEFFKIIGEMLRTSKIEDDLSRQKKIFLHNSKLASIGELAAGVAHEVNNPLAIAKGLLSMIQTDIRTLGVKDIFFEDRFEKIDLALERIGHIVRGLRTYSRIDSDELMHFNLMDVLSETFFMMKDIYNQQGICFELVGDRGDMEVYGSRGRLQQVFVNLITNARDATSGQPERKITVQYAELVHGVSVSVIDNGRGIPSELQGKVFEPFFTTKIASEGTGIGLSLVSSIIKEHDGSLDLNSMLGEGTTFTIILPAHLLRTKLEEAQKPSLKPEAAKQMSFRGKVLVVDDEEELQEILGDMLTRLGFTVFCASDGQQALDEIQREKFELVISDISMPAMDGFTFLEKLRSDSTIVQPKFIFITGGSDANDERFKTLKGQVDGLLPKPFRKIQIVEKLQFLFGVSE